ncbi:unnamed protein product [Clonostachys rosea f. rosea IK726]|uniref:Uncharacterized protein n=1 Tax=Clonostachys rosea f. rosea IK726 TaxID=1349383 RepID=A0ACA9U2A4_BIOOC|nr:unnamed protein product [Clonostachys rosea f. rosea IK726]
MIFLVLILLAVACPAHATWTDSASSNLATDLAPFLSLFGEKMLLHWISQSVTYFEVLVIAICPIGIPALIISALRLAGSQTARNIIGRPRESRPAVESELTPSTSDEVSECWDGHRVVRTIGDAKTQEYFVLKRVGASSTDRIVVKKLSECVATYIEIGEVPTFPGKTYQALKSTFNSLTRRLASLNLPSLLLAIRRYARRSSSASDVENNTVPLDDLPSRDSGSPRMLQNDVGNDIGVILIKNDKKKSPNLSLNIQEHLYPKFGDLFLFLALTGFFFGLIFPLILVGPTAKPLMSGFEMDWLSMTVAKGIQDAPWSQTLESRLHAESDSSYRPWAANDGWDWKAPSWEDLTKCVPLIPNAPLDSTARPSKAQEVLNLRKGIAKAGAALPPLTTLAVSVARAIEGTLDILTTSGEGYLEPGCRSLLWKIGGHPDDVVEFRLNLDDDGKKWNVQAGDLEAMLSLWLYKTSCGDKARETQPTAAAVPVGESISTMPPAGHATVGQEDEWLRKHSRKLTSLSPMPSEGNPIPALFQGINLWFTEPFRDTRQFGLVALEHDIPSSEPSPRRSSTLPAQSSYKRPSKSSSLVLLDEHFSTLDEVKTLVQEPEGSLQTSLAQHLFCLFMWSLAKTLKKPIGGGTSVAVAAAQMSPKGSRRTQFALENSCLRDISAKISLEGLGDQGIVFPALLLPLLGADKLPSAQTILEAAREYHDAYERKESQDINNHVYMWLFGNAFKLPTRKDLFLKVASVLIDSLEHMDLDHEPGWESRSAIKCTLTSVIKITRCYIGDSEWRFLKRVVSVSESHDSRFSSAFNWGLGPISVHSGNTQKPVSPHNHLTALHLFCLKGEDLSEEKITEVIRDNVDDINSVDVFGRAAIHYAVQRDNSNMFNLVNKLVNSGAKVNIHDLLGRTPLHLASHYPGVTSVVKKLMGQYKDFNVFDSKGLTPLHHAASWGKLRELENLRRYGHPTSFIFPYAAELVHFYARYREARHLTPMVNLGLMDLHDNRGRSGFHLAVINPKIKPEDIPEIFTDLTNFEHRDSFLESPLDLAMRISQYGCGHKCSSACKDRMNRFYKGLKDHQTDLRWQQNSQKIDEFCLKLPCKDLKQ